MEEYISKSAVVAEIKGMMTDKKKEDKLFLDIEHAIDAYIENKCKDLLETRISYEHGYEIKLSIKKIKV